MAKNLDVEIRELLRKRHGDWKSISERADVSYSWIAKFVGGSIDNPRYHTLLRLRELLKPSKVGATAAK